MRKYGKVFLALISTALLMLYPRDALEAAIQAMSVWATSFAPSLFPFFAILPALSCKEALALYQKIFGRVLPALFGVPGAAGAAVFVGWIAESPAGAMAVERIARAGGIGQNEIRRAALMSCGVSPMFLTAAVGVGLMGSRELGMILVRSQLFAAVTLGLGMKYLWRDETAPMEAQDGGAQAQAAPMREAAIQMLTVCGWMVMFGVAAKLATRMASLPALETPLLAVLEVTGGCAAISRLSISLVPKMLLLCATCCFGGLSILTQSMAKLKACGVRWSHMLGAKCVQMVLGVLACLVQLRFYAPRAAEVFGYGDAARQSVGLSSLLVVGTALGLIVLRMGARRTGARK